MTPQEQIVERVLVREGGVKDVGDGKGVTRWGQTSDWLERWSLPTPTTREEAATNYLAWLGKSKLALVVTTADDLADILVDVGVMSEAPKAFKLLQAALGIPVDGIPGPQTLAALATADRRHLARVCIAADMRYQGSLITLQPSRAQYAKGWANRMAAHVEALD